MQYLRDLARKYDNEDPLARYREQFHIPKVDGKPCAYFTGNSLGLQPATAKDAIIQELDDWAKHGVEGHFHARNPWYSYHELLMAPAAAIVGAKEKEVVHMNGLTANIHFLMVSFYRPEGERYKILCEAKAFPSDQYALESQVKFHGYRPEDAIIEIEPREGEHTLHEEDIEAKIEAHKDELALVFIGGVNYYTGQWFDMERITRAGREAGAVVGWDLAHAAGNVPVKLHDWDVDFAAWCTYKYLNSGPGSVSGIFIHEKYANDTDLPRFAGWWGHDKDERFLMEPGFKPVPGAEGWQLSNAPVFSMAPHLASLRIFAEAGMDALRQKSLKLTAFMQETVEAVAKSAGTKLEIITPKEPERRGCQLSLFAHGQGKSLFNHLMENGVYTDWREPNVIRAAPVPLYNSFADVVRFGEVLEEGLKK
ncbi:MAG: kynureninase [Cryomorphaceae bacterium]|nr:kynureninase [Flavobacteriales bacterium]